MNFDLPESHREIQRSVRELCLRTITPAARGWDHDGALPAETLAALAELGLLGVTIPDTLDGAGLDLLALTVVVEELARGDGALALAVATHNGPAVQLILQGGTDAQRARWLPSIARGERLAAASLDARGVRATRDADRWILDGAAPLVALGGTAGLCVVRAETEAGATAAFVVDRGNPGLSARRREVTLGMRACETSDLRLERCAVSDADRLPGDDAVALDRHRVALAALALGLGEGALDAAITYAKDRKQFGRPIADFQAIQWMLSDSRAELDAARMLTSRAALRDEPDAAEAAMAKLYASEVATRACSRALQVHGGYGYTREFPVERLLRDAQRAALTAGSPATQRALIARDLLASL